MKRIYSISALLATLIITTANVSALPGKPLSNDLSGIPTRVSLLESTALILQARANNIELLLSELYPIQGVVQANTEAITNLNNQYINLQSQSVEQEKTTNSLSSRLGTTEANLLDLQGEHSSLSTAQQGLLNQVVNLETNLAANTAQLSVLTTNLAQTSDSVASIGNDLQSLRVQIPTQSQIQLIETSIASLNELIISANNHALWAYELVSLNDSKVSSLESEQAVIKKKVSTLESYSPQTALARDGQNNIIGSLMGLNQSIPDYGIRYDIYIPSLNAIFPIDPTSGRMAQIGTFPVHFENRDCTGQAYDISQPNFYIRNAGSNDRYFAHSYERTNSAYIGSIMEGGQCRQDPKGGISANKMIEVYPAFRLPFQTPIKITPAY